MLTSHPSLIDKAYVYILRCSDQTLYCGYTTNLKRRLDKHNAAKGSRYTRCRLPVILAYFETFATKSEALRREFVIKKMTRTQKLMLLTTFDDAREA